MHWDLCYHQCMYPSARQLQQSHAAFRPVQALPIHRFRYACAVKLVSRLRVVRRLRAVRHYWPDRTEANKPEKNHLIREPGDMILTSQV